MSELIRFSASHSGVIIRITDYFEHPKKSMFDNFQFFSHPLTTFFICLLQQRCVFCSRTDSLMRLSMHLNGNLHIRYFMSSRDITLERQRLMVGWASDKMFLCRSWLKHAKHIWQLLSNYVGCLTDVSLFFFFHLFLPWPHLLEWGDKKNMSLKLRIVKGKVKIRQCIHNNDCPTEYMVSG